jgi:cholesterol transport system auxiliary component
MLVAALAGCGGEGVPVPSDRFHRITVGAPAMVYKTPQLAGTLEVDRFNAISVLQDRAIVFIEHDTPNVLHQYDYQLWADPPTLMMQGATVDYLESANVADQVIKSGLRVVPSYTLTGDIKRLEHVVGNSSSVVVELEFTLRDHENRSLVWIKRYTVEKAVDNDSVATATRAMGEAVEEILASLSADLARH